MLFKVIFHLSNGDEIVVDDVAAENQLDAWREVCQEKNGDYFIHVVAKATIHHILKGHLVDIETKDKNNSSFKNTETAMTAIEALSNMGL